MQRSGQAADREDIERQAESKGRQQTVRVYPRTGALAKAVWITTLRGAMEWESLPPSPPTTDITPLPHSTASVTLCTATRAAGLLTGAETNGTGPDGCLPELDMFPTVASHVFMVYVLLC